MRIINNPDFSQELKEILKYIANDKPSASKNFSKELKNNTKLILDNPYMYPPSFYFNDKDVRDMTCKKRSKSDTYDTSIRTPMTVSFGQ